jgi:hypothetical protein
MSAERDRRQGAELNIARVSGTRWDAAPPAARTREDLQPFLPTQSAEDRAAMGTDDTRTKERAADNPLWQLRYWDPTLFALYDGMHAIGGVIKDLFSSMFPCKRMTGRAWKYEQATVK